MSPQLDSSTGGYRSPERRPARTRFGVGAPEQRLIDQLAAGATIAQAARAVGYSERHARRILRGMWDELGARSNIEGMVMLARAGLLDPANDPGLLRQHISRAGPGRDTTAEVDTTPVEAQGGGTPTQPDQTC